VSGHESHQQKQGCNFGQQQHKWPSFSWQQPLQSQQVLQPQPQELLHPQLGAALQLLSQPHAGAEAAGAGAGAGAGVVGAGGACAAGAEICE
jgi:hypothetical protein